MANIENLVPNDQRTPEQRRANARKAGIASGKKRAEKKFLSQIYGEMLSETFDVQISDKQRKKLSSGKFFKYVTQKVLERADSASVAMLKEMADKTEKAEVPFVDDTLKIEIDWGKDDNKGQ